ncbi:MAG: Holliday junction branch migration protein RuvA [Chlamydiia bacterium]|nr:Holliday junction branch migration protein RuvA [Chlamydiia bacterium]
MFSYLNGTLSEATPSNATIDIQGVGYQAQITPTTYNALPQTGQKVMLFTSFVVRENAHTLYGFLTKEEKGLFESLLDVSGVGPKMALSLTGHLSPEELFGAIVKQDVKLLSKVPGIGKKTAERMILDLKDKAAKIAGAHPKNYLINLPLDQETEDALSALTNLGYTPSVAEKALKKVRESHPEGLSLGELITQALRAITVGR